MLQAQVGSRTCVAWPGRSTDDAILRPHSTTVNFVTDNVLMQLLLLRADSFFDMYFCHYQNLKEWLLQLFVLSSRSFGLVTRSQRPQVSRYRACQTTLFRSFAAAASVEQPRLRLGFIAPNFKAKTTQGNIDFSHFYQQLVGGSSLSPSRFHTCVHDRARRIRKDER